MCYCVRAVGEIRAQRASKEALDSEAVAHAEATAKAAEEAKAKAAADASAKAEAAAKAKAQREAEERFASESRAKQEADDAARAEAKAEDQKKAALRKLVGSAKLDAIKRCEESLVALPPKTEDDLAIAVSDLLARSSCKSDSDKVGTVAAGTTVRVLETREPDGVRRALVQLLDSTEPFGWVKARLGADKDGKEGKGDKGGGDKEGGRPALVSTIMAIKPSESKKDSVMLREKPGAKAAEKQTLKAGTRLHVIETEVAEGCTWAKIALEGTDYAEAGWIRHTDKNGVKQLLHGDAPAGTKAGGKDGGKEPAAKAAGGKGAATRKAAVVKVEATEEVTVAKQSVLSLVKYRRLASARNNNDTCPVRQRHDGASRHELTGHEGVAALIFNCYKAKFEVAEGSVDAVPTASSYNLVTYGGEVVGSVGVADKKGIDFRERVKFKNAWLPGAAHGLFHPSDQGDASLELMFEFKLPADGGGAEKVCKAFLLVSPWLSYSCSVGARFMLKKPGDAEGKTATIQRLLGDDRCAMRVDGEAKETLVDPRPDTCIPTAIARHAPGTHVMYLAGSSCVDAVVEEMPVEEWNKGTRRRQHGSRLPDAVAGAKHWLRVQTEGHPASGKLIEADLNLTNYCVQRFATVAAYEEARLLHCAEIVERERHVEDAITGNTLDIAEQLVDVSTQEGVEGSINRLGETITNVKDLARILRRPDEHRKNGSHVSQPVLVRAGPGTGKTWMSKQAAYTLADQLGECAEAGVHKGVKMVPVIMYIQQIVYVLRDTEAPPVSDLLEVYLRKVYPEWHVATLLQAYQMRALIMIMDGVDEAAGMRQYIEDFVLRVLVPSGNRILITSRREGISDLTPYIDVYFTVLDLKELSNEQQRSVIRAQMDGNEFFDHVLALGEMRRGLDGVWSTRFTAKERKELEGFFCTEKTEEEVEGAAAAAAVADDAAMERRPSSTAVTAAAAAKPPSSVAVKQGELPALVGPALQKAILAAVERCTEEAGGEAPTFSFAPPADEASGEVVCSTAALVILLLNSLIEGVDVDAGDDRTARLVMTAAVNKFVDLDVTHFRFAEVTLALSSADGAASVKGIRLEVHQADVKKAAKGETHTAAEHYAFFRSRMAHLAADGDDAIDRLLEPALIFLVDATGVPVLLSLLVLIFTSGGEDLSQLPKSQFELYQMGIQFAMDKRLLSSSQEGTAAAGVSTRGAALAYDDKAVTVSLVKRWNKLFALEAVKVEMVSTPRASSKKLSASASADGEGGEGEGGKKKQKKEKVSRKASGLGLGEGGGKDAKQEKSSIDKTESFTNEDLYEIFRQAARYLGAAARGVGRKELNNIELQACQNTPPH